MKTKIKNLSYYNKVWITSDTHFNHRFMIDKEIRPLDYNEQIIANINKMVGQDDLLIHLGDVIFDRQWELRPIIELLPWTKLLVRGNHDGQGINWYKTHGFHDVCDELIITWQNDIKLLLTHKPEIRKWYINMCWHLHQWKDNPHRISSTLVNSNTRVYSQEHMHYKPIDIWDFAADIYNEYTPITSSVFTRIYDTIKYWFIKYKGRHINKDLVANPNNFTVIELII